MNAQQVHSYTITAFGVAPFEQEVLGRIFALSSTRAKHYVLAREGAPDIHLVDQDNPLAAEQWRAAQVAAAGNPPPTVVVAREAPPGCDFHLRRPFVASRLLTLLDRVVEQSLSRRPEPPPAEPQARYRALVVDDSLAVRTQVSRALERARISADLAEDGHKALDLIEDRGYDIVFLDVTMPGMDGYEVCKAIKRKRDRRHIPVVMLTGRSSPIDRVRGKLSGCDSYLAKPVSRGDFVGTLKKHLKAPIVLE